MLNLAKRQERQRHRIKLQCDTTAGTLRSVSRKVNPYSICAANSTELRPASEQGHLVDFRRLGGYFAVIADGTVVNQSFGPFAVDDPKLTTFRRQI
jgi:hypothetical protein